MIALIWTYQDNKYTNKYVPIYKADGFFNWYKVITYACKYDDLLPDELFSHDIILYLICIPMLKRWRKFPPKTRESSGVSTACIQPEN